MHIVLDHVQFEKNSFVNRNRVRTAKGWTWLTVPVRTKGRFGNLQICDLEISLQAAWRRKHWDTIRFSYSRGAYFARHVPFFRAVYGREWERLNELLREITHYLLSALGITTRIVFSSEVAVSGEKEKLVLNLCRAVGARSYISGPQGRGYLDPSAFARAGIDLLFHDYRHPQYRQLYPGFEPYMSVVDVLFNHGSHSLRLLTNGQRLSRV